MNPTPEPPAIPPPGPAADQNLRWRKTLWVALVVVTLTLPAGLIVGSTGMLLLESALKLFGWHEVTWLSGRILLVAIGLSVVVLALASVARVGLRRGWYSPRLLAWGWSGVALTGFSLLVVIIPAFKQVRLTSQAKAVMSNLHWMEGTADRFFSENPHRLFVRYDELVGPGKYTNPVNPIVGEDYRDLFPMRRDGPDSLSINLPDGRRVDYPDPPEVHPDGLYAKTFPDGSRFESTYRGGMPDGPFRAYYPDGKLWCEANYVKGRLTGPSWLYTRDGRKFDELSAAEADHSALADH